MLAVLLVAGFGLTACAHLASEDTPSRPAAVTPELTNQGDAVFLAPGNGVMPQKGSGKLSARLQTLADNPELKKQDPSTQAEALGLPAQGSGSLMRNQAGEILVRIRVTQITQVDPGVLEEIGVHVVQVDDSLRTVTAFARPADLAAMADLEYVEYIQEELRP